MAEATKQDDSAEVTTARLCAVGDLAPGEARRYDVAGPGTEMRQTFRLTKVDGEWRIDQVPQGLLLSQTDVDRAFRSFAVSRFLSHQFSG